MRSALPDKFLTADDAVNWLAQVPSFQTSGISAANFGLDRMRAASAMLGYPEKKVPALHVAGTNGKGSVCAMLASVYRSAGYRVGLYTSPHLIRFNERIRVNGQEIEGDALLNAFNAIIPALTSFELTYFEITTLLAFVHFKTENCDLAVIETGLGGRLDATNIIQPKLSIITSIGFDHQDVLGNTLELIAAEKAGIIKPECPVICGALPEVALEVVRGRAKALNACFFHVDNTKAVPLQLSEVGEVQPSLLGEVQYLNAQMVMQAVQLMQQEFAVNARQLAHGLQHIQELSGFRARFEKLHPELNWYFDGGHNEEAIRAVKSILRQFDSAPILFLAMMQDKVRPEITSLFSDFSKIYYYSLQSGRAASYTSVQHSLPQLLPLPEDPQVLSSILQAHRDDLVLFTGSFYFYPTVRQWMETLFETHK